MIETVWGIRNGTTSPFRTDDKWRTKLKRNCPDCRFHRAWKLKDGRLKCRRCGKRYTFQSVWQVSRITERTKGILVHDFSEDNIEVPLSGSGGAQKRFHHRSEDLSQLILKWVKQTPYHVIKPM